MNRKTNRKSRTSLRAVWVVIIALTLLPWQPVYAMPAPPSYGEAEAITSKDPVPYLDPEELVAINDAVFFTAEDDAGYEIWWSLPPYNDATTSRLTDINPDGDANPRHLTVIGNTLFFAADDGKHGVELWKLDPPYNQPLMVADINPYGDSNPQYMTALGNLVFFQANNGADGVELWKTQLPYLSAQEVIDLFPGSPDGDPRYMKAIGWTLFFTGYDSIGRELFKLLPPYDRTSISRVTDLNPGGSANPIYLVTIDDLLFFSAVNSDQERQLYKSAPPYTPETIVRVDEIAKQPAPEDPYDLAVIGDTLFYSGYYVTSGYELRMVRPPYTATQISRVKDLNKTQNPLLPGVKATLSSNPDFKTVIGSTLFFVADDNVTGMELWKVNAPYDEDSVEQVLDIRKGSGGSNPQYLTVVGSTLFFRATNDFGTELWKSEPPYDSDSTKRVTDIMRGGGSSAPIRFTPVNRHILFTSASPNGGREVYHLLRSYWLPDTGFAPGVITARPAKPAGVSFKQMDEMVLSIPKIQLSSPIIGVPDQGEGWDLTWLENQVGYLAGTAFPTWAGNTVLSGHAYLANGQPGPFAALGALQWGDVIQIDSWGQRYVYEIREVKTVDPSDQSAFKHEDLDWVTLITCKDFDEAANQYRSRLVVRAVLVRVTQSQK